jgi:hypothetical protein
MTTHVHWLYRHAGRVHGPVSLADLRAAYALGFVEPQDMVCRAVRHERWAPACTVPELRRIDPPVPRSPPE